MTVKEMIDHYQTLSLSVQLDEWFGEDGSMMKGLCAAQCIETKKNVAEVMIDFEMQLFQPSPIFDFNL